MNTRKVHLQDGLILEGYETEYVFHKINEQQDFFEAELLRDWAGKYIFQQSVVYDIGANLGNHTVYFSKVAGAASVYAFEPYSLNFDLLCKNTALNNLENCYLKKMALGNRGGTVNMKIQKENNFGTARICGCEEGEAVQLCTLDSLSLPLPDFIKLDVEGCELAVLQGMGEILKNGSPILWVEVCTETAAEVFEFLEQYGFQLADMRLQQDNNVLFIKNTAGPVKSSALFFHLLHLAEQSREMHWERNHAQSRYTFERQKCENLKQELQYSKDSLMQEQMKFTVEQNRLDEAAAKISALQAYVAELEAVVEKYENEIEQKNLKIVEGKRQSGKLQATINGYHTSILFRLLSKYWSISKKFAAWRHQTKLKIARRIYYSLTPYPKVKAFCIKVNNRFHLIQNPAQMLNPIYVGNPKRRNADAQEPPSRNQLNVAMIADEFTYNSLKYECSAFVLDPEGWESVFEKNPIDFFFCESAWSGTDSQKRPWKGKIYKSTNFSQENRGILLQILQYCKTHHIPTVFWNKEDPTFYGSQLFDFGDTARRFDHIFTTAIECIPRYKEDYGHKSVHLMMFATQPRIFNPIETAERTKDIVFAGGWYKEHPERCAQMRQIFDQLLGSGFSLKIFDRYAGTEEPNHKFPQKYSPYLHPNLPYSQMNFAYKSGVAALNINTVTDSDTMFARRVFELMSCNTLVISNQSTGMKKLFDDRVLFLEEDTPLTMANWEEKRRACLDDVLKNHTYKQRFQRLVEVLGIPCRQDPADISIVYRVDTMQEAQESIQHAKKCLLSNYKIILFISQSSSYVRQITESFQNERTEVYAMHYLDCYKKSVALQTPYFVLSNRTDSPILDDKALRHFQYLEPDIGIRKHGKAFTTELVNIEENLLLPSRFFSAAYEYLRWGARHQAKVLSI